MERGEESYTALPQKEAACEQCPIVTGKGGAVTAVRENMELERKKPRKGHCGFKHGIIKEFLAEFLGTFVLVLFGCGSVAQTVLSRGALGENLTIHIGFTMGLMMASYIAGGISGAHVNPAVSLAMVILGKLKVVKFPVYVVAQLLGAFAGAAAVFGLYYDAFMDYTSGILSVTGINATAHIFASYPARYLSILNGFIDQVVATGVLVLCILAIVDGRNIGAPRGMEPMAIGLIVMAIGVSMGLNCGYPINPARDLGPRLFTAVAGWGMDVFSTADNWWWIPVAGPMVGGIVGAVVYFLLIELHHTRTQEQQEEEEEEEEDDDEEGEDDLKDKYEMITIS